MDKYKAKFVNQETGRVEELVIVTEPDKAFEDVLFGLLSNMKRVISLVLL